MPKLSTDISRAPEQVSLEERNKRAEQALAIRFDALNQLFSQAEQLLKALKPPHPVWHFFNFNSEVEGMATCEMIGIAKHHDKWRICHAYDYEDSDGNPEITPIIERPVDIRIGAAGEIRQLHEKIVEAKEQYIPKVEQAIMALNEACALAKAKGVK